MRRFTNTDGNNTVTSQNIEQTNLTAAGFFSKTFTKQSQKCFTSLMYQHLSATMPHRIVGQLLFQKFSCFILYSTCNLANHWLNQMLLCGRPFCIFEIKPSQIYKPFYISQIRKHIINNYISTVLPHVVLVLR